MDLTVMPLYQRLLLTSDNYASTHVTLRNRSPLTLTLENYMSVQQKFLHTHTVRLHIHTTRPLPPAHIGQAGGRLKSHASSHLSTHSMWNLWPQRSTRSTSPLS